jgi:hypothetical protein
MTLQQTVSILADRRLHLDLPLPRDTPIGEADVKLIITLHRATVPRSDKPVAPHRRPFEGLFGCTKGSGVWDGDAVEIIRKLRNEW